MARRADQSKEKPQVDYHQRTVRRNQIIIGVFSLFLILSMILSLLINI